MKVQSLLVLYCQCISLILYSHTCPVSNLFDRFNSKCLASDLTVHFLWHIFSIVVKCRDNYGNFNLLICIITASRILLTLLVKMILKFSKDLDIFSACMHIHNGSIALLYYHVVGFFQCQCDY